MSEWFYQKKYKKAMFMIAPYAGGSSQGFGRWNSALSDKVLVNIFDYAGHGRRISEAVATNFEDLIEDLEKQILAKSVEQDRMILFGHSMGAIAIAAVASKLYEKLRINFQGIILSCCMSPECLSKRKNVIWKDEDLISYLNEIRDIPMEIIKTVDFMKYIFPAIKNDFNIMQAYRFDSIKLPPCPIHCLWAEQDYSITRETMVGWQKYTEKQIVWNSIKGTHFYFEEYPNETFELLKKIIDKIEQEKER